MEDVQHLPLILLRHYIDVATHVSKRFSPPQMNPKRVKLLKILKLGDGVHLPGL